MTAQPQPRGRSLFWLCMAALPVLVLLNSRITPGDSHQLFLQYRVYFWLWMALGSFFAVWYCFFKGAGIWKVYRSHAFVFMALSCAHCILAPQVSRFLRRPEWGQYAWFNTQAIYRLVVILCCVAWIINARRQSSSKRPGIDRPAPVASPVSDRLDPVPAGLQRRQSA